MFVVGWVPVETDKEDGPGGRSSRVFIHARRPHDTHFDIIIIVLILCVMSDIEIEPVSYRIPYQLNVMIAYAIVRHHPDRKIIRAILSRVVADQRTAPDTDPETGSETDDPGGPVRWTDVFRNLLEKMEDGQISTSMLTDELMRKLIAAGPCPRLLTIGDIIKALDIPLPNGDGHDACRLGIE